MRTGEVADVWDLGAVKCRFDLVPADGEAKSLLFVLQGGEDGRLPCLRTAVSDKKSMGNPRVPGGSFLV